MRISDWSSDVCSSDLDVAPARGADRGGDTGLENQVAERAHSLGRRAFIGRAGPGVERDQIDLCGQAILLEQPHQFVSVGVAVILVLQHHIFRSEEHTSELQSLMRISYAAYCLK